MPDMTTACMLLWPDMRPHMRCSALYLACSWHPPITCIVHASVTALIAHAASRASRSAEVGTQMVLVQNLRLSKPHMSAGASGGAARAEGRSAVRAQHADRGASAGRHTGHQAAEGERWVQAFLSHTLLACVHGQRGSHCTLQRIRRQEQRCAGMQLVVGMTDLQVGG